MTRIILYCTDPSTERHPGLSFLILHAHVLTKKKGAKLRTAKILHLDNSTCINEQIVYLVKSKKKSNEKESVVTRVTTELVYKIN